MNVRPSRMMTIIPNNPNHRIPMHATATDISFLYQVSSFSSPRQHVPMPKTSRLTRIGKFISTSNKVTIAILSHEDKVTVGVNQDKSDPKLDKLVQPSPAKKTRHNDAAHFMP